MNANAGTIDIARCAACLARFLPADGPCPRCGAVGVVTFPVPGLGKVLAATELLVPPPGVPAPHRLMIVEIAEGVRLLASTDEPLPTRGTLVSVRKDGDIYRARADPAAAG